MVPINLSPNFGNFLSTLLALLRPLWQERGSKGAVPPRRGFKIDWVKLGKVGNTYVNDSSLLLMQP